MLMIIINLLNGRKMRKFAYDRAIVSSSISYVLQHFGTRYTFNWSSVLFFRHWTIRGWRIIRYSLSFRSRRMLHHWVWIECKSAAAFLFLMENYIVKIIVGNSKLALGQNITPEKLSAFSKKIKTVLQITNHLTVAALILNLYSFYYYFGFCNCQKKRTQCWRCEA